ncbi:tail fiber domain-containing protein [Mesorhizobium sp. B2-3-4]|uniref:tail fiber domain-containing protein n=1 Tax=Mesorhizobium sp. B2-3-4 TaxID=2589959 RepID=UPI0015E42AD2|nr:tail fiber domain-containing protein [Mesorhizobium sp. B2-3-4]
MGSILSPKTPAAPPPPPPVDYINSRDEVAGTQSNYVTNPDGTKTLVTSQLPLTEEQQAVKDKLDSIAKQNLDYIDTLTNNYDISQVPGLADYVNSYKAQQIQGLDQATSDQTNQSETALARFGQADSTAAIKDRAARGYNYQQGRQTIDQNAAQIEQQGRQQAIGNATNLYQLATGGIQTNLSNLESSLGQQQQFQLNDAGLQTSRNNAIYSGALQQQQLQQQASQAGLGNIAALAGLATLAAGPAGFGLYGLASKAGTSAVSNAAINGYLSSDRRLKTDIQLVGKLDSGLNVYRYRYKAGGPVMLGVMADEVEDVNPDAVMVGPRGFKMVDYGKLN